MSTKAEREKDKAICEAATPDWREGAAEKWNLYCRTTHPERMGNERVLMRANEHFPYEADMRAAARCRNRLPEYIADAEEMERRVTQVEKLLAQTQERVAISRGAGMMVHALEDEQRASLYSEVLCILRGVS